MSHVASSCLRGMQKDGQLQKDRKFHTILKIKGQVKSTCLIIRFL